MTKEVFQVGDEGYTESNVGSYVNPDGSKSPLVVQSTDTPYGMDGGTTPDGHPYIGQRSYKTSSAFWEKLWNKRGLEAIQRMTANLQTLGLNPPCGAVDILGILSEGLSIPKQDLETELENFKIPAYPYQDQTLLPLCQ